LKIEAELEFTEISLALADELNSLAPFGQNNPQPRLASYDLRINDIVTMGYDNQHIKFRLSPASGSAASFWALAFSGANGYKDFKIGDYVDLAYYLEANDFNGRREAQLKIVDLKLNTTKHKL
jgi:single-stranded-DNA-specific exonuclease